MRKSLFTLTLLIFGFSTTSSSENYPSGARARALSNAIVSVPDVWSTFHNPAGIAGMQSAITGIYYESRFMVNELSLAAGTFILPVKPGTFGASFFQFGKGNFKEYKFGVAFSKSLSEKISAGIQLDYFSQFFPENSQPRGFATFDAGLIYMPVENLGVAVSVFNPVHAGFNTQAGKQKMPVTFRAGGHYMFSELLMFTTEIQKDSDYKPVLKTGIELTAIRKLFLRIGISTRPAGFSAGIGYRLGKMGADFAFSHHGNLGMTPSVSVQFEF